MNKTRLSDDIATRLQVMIVDGEFQLGSKLPPERELAESLSVSRSSLREALQSLKSRGLLYTRRGGGTFVSENIVTDCHELVSLFKSQPETRFDVLEVRHGLETTAAYYAALRHTEADKRQIQAHYQQMLDLHDGTDPLQEARADASFHLSIAEASHNPVLVYVMKNLFDLLQSSVYHNLDKIYTLPQVFEPLNQQHLRLMQKVLERDADGARQAAKQHLVYVEESLQQIDRSEAQKLRDLRNLSLARA